MKRFIVFMTLAFFAIPLLSQTKGYVEICIRDSADVIPDAAVMFFMSDSLVAVSTTNQQGCCSLNLETGNYVVHITHLGHEEHMTNLQLSSSGVNLSAEMKRAAIELDEVTVSKKVYETVLNKNIYNVPANILKTSTDVYDILQHVPALTVNTIERTIKLALSQNYIVTVNNIKRDNTYLALLNPKDVEKIEIIRYPGMRYKDIDAIINIVTRAKSVTGQVFMATGRLSPISMDNAYLNFGYRHHGEKLSVMLYATGERFNEKKNESSFVRDIESAGTITHMEKYSNKGKAVTDNIRSNLSAIFDYAASQKTHMILNMFCNYFDNQKYTPYTGIMNYDDESFALKSSDDSDKEGGNYGIIAYYQTDFTKDCSMNIETTYKSGKSNTNTLLSETFGDNTVSENSQLMNEQWQSVDIQVNAVQQLKKIKLEEGYRGYWFDNIIDIASNKNASNISKHNDLRNYFYANTLGGIGKHFAYQAGIGLDMVHVFLNDRITDNRTELTPNAMLRYNINDRQNITLNYSLARQSPASSLVLNSVPVYDGDDTTQVFLGNPRLKPYYQNALRLDYEFFTPEKFYAGLSLRHNFANNVIVQKKYLENGIHYTTYVNASNYSAYSAAFDFNFNITKWWQVSLSSSVTFRAYKDPEAALNKNYTSYSAWFENTINYNRWWIYFSYFPSIKNPTLTGYHKREEYSNLTISYRRNPWRFVIQTYCMFSPAIETTETYSEGFSQIYTRNNKNQRLRVTFSIGYYLQKGDQKADQRKRSKQYDEVVAN